MKVESSVVIGHEVTSGYDSKENYVGWNDD